MCSLNLSEDEIIRKVKVEKQTGNEKRIKMAGCWPGRGSWWFHCAGRGFWSSSSPKHLSASQHASSASSGRYLGNREEEGGGKGDENDWCLSSSQNYLTIPSQKSRALLLLAARLMQSEMSSTSIFSSLHSHSIFTSCQSQVTNVSSFIAEVQTKLIHNAHNRFSHFSRHSVKHLLGPASSKWGFAAFLCHFWQ